MGMRSNNLLEDWLKLCDALLISIPVQSILAMKLFKDFKLLFTQKKAHKFNINRKYKSKTMSELTKYLICGF